MSETKDFLVAHASAAKWKDAASEIIVSLKNVTAEHRLGFLYVTDDYADSLKDIYLFLKQNTGVPHWVGTVGFGICAPATEYFGKAAMAVMIAPIPEDAFRTFNGVKSDVSAVVSNLQEWIGDTPPLIVTHADPRNQNVPEIIEDLSRETNGFLIGGLTASRGAHPQLAEDVAEGEVSGVMMSLEAVPVAAALTQGCSPIGEIHRITSCEQNILIEIDGKPALDVFKEDIGEILARDLSKVAGYIFAALPVSGSDTGDYLVRNLTGIDPEQGLLAIGEYVEPGDHIMFCRRDHDSAVEDMRRMLGDLRKRAGNTPIRGGLYYSCCARGPNQFGENSEELALIAEELGDFPLVGFFANGEISNNRLYGYTGVLTLFL
ncbi:MAG: FIST N-terminal domain-containing protein [Pseudomonadota bacterium]|nr:FIST N-terminal domain-containing protein [Pseudomonadota bacterium]